MWTQTRVRHADMEIVIYLYIYIYILIIINKHLFFMLLNIGQSLATKLVIALGYKLTQ